MCLHTYACILRQLRFVFGGRASVHGYQAWGADASAGLSFEASKDCSETFVTRFLPSSSNLCPLVCGFAQQLYSLTVCVSVVLLPSRWKKDSETVINFTQLWNWYDSSLLHARIPVPSFLVSSLLTSNALPAIERIRLPHPLPFMLDDWNFSLNWDTALHGLSNKP